MGRSSLVFMALWVAANSGCSRPPDPPAAPSRNADLSGLPVTMEVRQRSTTVVPGSGDRLRVTVDDVTRGQVIVSVTTDDGPTVLGPVSLRRGGSAGFTFGDSRYRLTLSDFTNRLIGRDSATVVLSEASRHPLSEREKIERLLEHLGGMKSAVFIRNGTEHPATEAVRHLRSKWESGASSIVTASQFIDAVATRSSFSGEPYQIRLPDGSTVPAGRYLHERLQGIERDL